MTIATDPTKRAGLVFTIDGDTDPQTVPLTLVDVHASIVGPTQRVTLTQKYQNDLDQPVEATYVFPMPAGAAVNDFVARLDGAELRGCVKEAEEAFEDYDDAVQEGRNAWLLDANRPDLFTVSVGNLLPDAELEIQISYVAELPREGRGFRLVIPQNFTPKYFPQENLQDEGLDDAEAVNAPRTARGLPYSWNIEVDVDLMQQLGKLSSPSHRIDVEFVGNLAHVKLAHGEGRPDRDFVLNIAGERDVLNPAGIFADGDHRYLAVSLDPEVDTSTETAIDAVFLIDCSGSMHGPSIADARRAMLVALSSLREGDRFQIVRFGSHFEKLTDRPVDYDDKHLRKAKKSVERMNADLGGTELGTPLQEIAKAAKKSERATNLVLITDGATGDDARLIEFARKHRDHLRVFTIGVGPMASQHLIEGLAEASGGAAEFVVPGEQIAGKVARHFRRLRVEVIEKVSFEFEGLKIEDLYPDPPGRLFPGDIVSLYGKVEGGKHGWLTVRGFWRSEPWSLQIPIESSSAESAVPVLWAKQKCSDLESSWLGSQDFPRRGNPRHARRVVRDAREKLVELARQFNLVTLATSFVVVDDREDAPRATQPAQFVRTPLAQAGEFLGGEATLGVRQLARTFGSDPTDRVLSVMKCAGLTDEAMYSLINLRSAGEPDAKSSLDVLRWQKADGSFEPCKELFEFIELDAETAREILDGNPDNALREATEQVIRWSHQLVGDDRSALAEAMRKASDWLKAHAD